MGMVAPIRPANHSLTYRTASSLAHQSINRWFYLYSTRPYSTLLVAAIQSYSTSRSTLLTYRSPFAQSSTSPPPPPHLFIHHTDHHLWLLAHHLLIAIIIIIIITIIEGSSDSLDEPLKRDWITRGFFFSLHFSCLLLALHLRWEG